MVRLFILEYVWYRPTIKPVSTDFLEFFFWIGLKCIWHCFGYGMEIFFVFDDLSSWRHHFGWDDHPSADSKAMDFDCEMDSPSSSSHRRQMTIDGLEHLLGSRGRGRERRWGITNVVDHQKRPLTFPKPSPNLFWAGEPMWKIYKRQACSTQFPHIQHEYFINWCEMAVARGD